MPNAFDGDVTLEPGATTLWQDRTTTPPTNLLEVGFTAVDPNGVRSGPIGSLLSGPAGTWRNTGGTSWEALAAVQPGTANTAYVDAINGDDATAALGTTRAFQTMQAAVNACKAAHDAIYGTLPPSPPSVVIPPAPRDARQGFVIDVAPYTSYDEDVLAGTFTGNAGAKIRLDLASNTSLVENGNSVVGWTKTLLNDATP